MSQTIEETKETVRLYDRDAYATEFTARVLSCNSVGDNQYEIILDQTLFFPEEGGQSPDKGILQGIPVLDVQIKKGIITHTLSSALEPGQTVTGQIDWNHRFSNMQQHSGEHIFSGIVNKEFGYDNVGFHLSDQIVTLDFSGVLSESDVEYIEYKVNEAISKNVEVEVSFPSKEELAKLEYRSKIEIEGQVRIVSITGYDVCACCAPHVRRTGEIGGLKVMSIQNYKGGVRISILCGFRMLEAFREKAKIINSLTTYLTTNQNNLLETVTKLKTQGQNLSSQLASAKQTLLEHKLSDIPDDQKDVILFESGIDGKIGRNVINGLVKKHDGICALFNGDDQSGYNFIISSSSVNVSEIAEKIRTSLAAKCGGGNQMIQGSVNASQAEIEKILCK